MTLTQGNSRSWLKVRGVWQTNVDQRKMSQLYQNTYPSKLVRKIWTRTLGLYSFDN